MKSLLFDLETSPHLSYTWGKYEQDVIAFKEEGTVICFAYKWLGEKSVHAVALRDFKKNKEKSLALELHKLFNEADVIIAHNGDRFDIKMSNRLFAKFGLDPTSPYKTIDTKKLAKERFMFSSNKLDDLGNYLGVGRKMHTGGFDLWLGCMAGDEKAWKKMIKYNKQDVVLLEKVYLKLRPWSKTHPRLIEGDTLACPVCGSKKILKRGFNSIGTYIQQRYQCKSCGRWGHGGNIKRTISKQNQFV